MTGVDDLVNAARRFTDDGVVHWTQDPYAATPCQHCGESWPCPTAKLRAALARLDGETYG